MNDIDMPIQWQEGRGESVEIGYFNPNGQQCCGHCGVPGTDYGRVNRGHPISLHMVTIYIQMLGLNYCRLK